jgi:hypothetical protein
LSCGSSSCRPPSAPTSGFRHIRHGHLALVRERIDPAPDELAAAAAVFAAFERLGLGVPAYARIDLARGPDGVPLLMEAEVLEPALFLDRAPRAAPMLVDCVLNAF